MNSAMGRAALAAIVLAVGGVGLVGCSGQETAEESSAEATQAVGVEAESSASESSSSTSSSESATSQIQIIDVRNADEYAEGHLDGAVNLDLNSGQFADSISSLDPEGTYAIYCRSGNRSAEATAMLLDSGFANVIDLGSVEDAAEEVGVEIVK